MKAKIELPLNAESEIAFHIEQLSAWLRDHTPRDNWTPGQFQTYDDRVQALMCWLARSQQIPH